MRGRKNIHILLVIVCVILAMTGCREKKQTQGTSESASASVSPTAEVTPRPLDKYHFKAEVVSPTAIKLKWDKIRRGTDYKITRNLQMSDYTGGVVFQRLPLEETSILDESLELGKDYCYTITTRCDYDELDRDWYGWSQIKYILEANLHFHTRVPEIVFETWTPDKKWLSSDAITLRYKIDGQEKRHYWLGPTGIEIYRGKSYDSCHKIAEEEMDQERGYDLAKMYIDRDVKARKEYYYQVRAFADIDGIRYYGKMTKPIKLSAVEPKGKYRLKLLTKTAESVPALQLALIGKRAGNDELFPDRKALENLVDYIYRTKDGTYTSLRLKLNRYRQKGKEWKTYRGESLSILGRERIDLEFIAQDGVTQIPYRSKGLKEGEIIFHTRYNEKWFKLHMDLVNQKVSMQLQKEPDYGE